MKEKENIYGDREDCLASDSNRVPSLDEKKENEKKKKGNNRGLINYVCQIVVAQTHTYVRTCIHTRTYRGIHVRTIIIVPAAAVLE